MVGPPITGIAEMEDAKEQSISYPNPFQSSLNINLLKGSVTITDLMGIIYFENTTFEGVEILTENWPKGVYLIKCAGSVSKILKD
jgi:hypothetical protein